MSYESQFIWFGISCFAISMALLIFLGFKTQYWDIKEELKYKEK